MGGFDTERTANAAKKSRAVAKTNRGGRERNLGIRNVFRLCGLRFVFRWLCCPAADAGMIVRGVFGVVKCFDGRFLFFGDGLLEPRLWSPRCRVRFAVSFG